MVIRLALRLVFWLYWEEVVVGLLPSFRLSLLQLTEAGPKLAMEQLHPLLLLECSIKSDSAADQVVLG